MFNKYLLSNLIIRWARTINSYTCLPWHLYLKSFFTPPGTYLYYVNVTFPWVVDIIPHIYAIPSICCASIINCFISFVVGSCNHKWDKFPSLNLKILISTHSYKINLCVNIVLIMPFLFTALFPLYCWYYWYTFLILVFRVFHNLGPTIFPVLSPLTCQVIHRPLKLSSARKFIASHLWLLKSWSMLLYYVNMALFQEIWQYVSGPLKCSAF